MKTQEQVDDLIKVIDAAEEKESVTNQMEAAIFEFLNEKLKKEESRHVTLTEEAYETLVKSGKVDPDSIYLTFEKD